jgi:hypothetical protein
VVVVVAALGRLFAADIGACTHGMLQVLCDHPGCSTLLHPSVQATCSLHRECLVDCHDDRHAWLVFCCCCILGGATSRRVAAQPGRGCTQDVVEKRSRATVLVGMEHAGRVQTGVVFTAPIVLGKAWVCALGRSQERWHQVPATAKDVLKGVGIQQQRRRSLQQPAAALHSWKCSPR